MIGLDQFSEMIPTNKNPKEWYIIAVDMFKKYDITTPLRIAGFMSQCAHESLDFTILEENLNYREETLKKIFPRYFGPGKRNAADYAKNPEKIANYVYMDEFRSKSGALGNTQPGDGWRFRGRGIKQLTGRNNYTAFAKTVGMTAEQAAAYLETKTGAFESACWFWKKNNLASFADKDDILGMTKRINGGTIGIKDRTARYEKAKIILSSKRSEQVLSKKEPISKTPQRTLTLGMKGDDVKRLQAALGITEDGDFSFGTATALKKWQRNNGFIPDGIANSATLKKLLKL